MRTVTVAKLIDIILSYLVILYVGRYQEPEVLGIYLVVTSYSALMATLMQLGSASAILSDFKRRKGKIYLDKNKLLSRSYVHLLYSATCIAVALIAISLFEVSISEIYIYAIVGFIISFGVSSLTALTSILRAANQVELATIIDSLAKNTLPALYVIAVMMGLLKFSIFIVFGLQSAGIFFAVLISICEIKIGDKIRWFRGATGNDFQFYTIVVKFGISGFLFTAMRQVDTLLVAKFLGAETAGAYRISMLPSMLGLLVYGSAASVAMPNFSSFEAYTNYLSNNYGKIRKIGILSFIFSVLLYLIFAGKLYQYFFGIEDPYVYWAGLISLIVPFATFIFYFAYEYHLMMRRNLELIYIVASVFVGQLVIFISFGENLNIIISNLIVWFLYLLTNLLFYLRIK